MRDGTNAHVYNVVIVSPSDGDLSLFSAPVRTDPHLQDGLEGVGPEHHGRLARVSHTHRCPTQSS